MLSRVANSIYWMCRYIERAENVARFISVNLNLFLDMPSERGKHWEPVVLTTGDHEEFEQRYGEYRQEEVIRFLTFDRDYANSILYCLGAARENARSIREVISSEMWEHLNAFFLDIATEKATVRAVADPPAFFKMILMRCHLFAGLMESTMSHGEPWLFARMGMMLERADKTSRILDVKYFMLLPRLDLVNSPVDNIQWTAVLKSASAFEMYRKTYQLITPRRVAEFLIFDMHFPRSIRYCVYSAQDSLYQITGTTTGAAHNLAEKRLGRLASDLEFSDIDEVVDFGMHEYHDALQTKLNGVDEAVGLSFFNIAPKPAEQSQKQLGGGSA